MYITYRTATAEDIPVILEFCRQLILDYEQLESIDFPRVMNWVRQKIEGAIGEYTVIYVREEKAGYYHFCQNSDGQYELDDLYIFPQFQNRGIGSAVIRKCCQSVNAPVMLYVFIQNRRAVALYRTLGFEVTKTIGSSRYIMCRENR